MIMKIKIHLCKYFLYNNNTISQSRKLSIYHRTESVLRVIIVRETKQNNFMNDYSQCYMYIINVGVIGLHQNYLDGLGVTRCNRHK